MYRIRRLVVAVAFTVAAFALGHADSIQAQTASPPASATAPAPHRVELLFVQNGLSGSFDGKTLTLKGVGPTLFFSDRPDRVTGHLGTAEFVGHWDKGPNSFAKNPPNATLSILGEKGVTSAVVELTRPRLERSTLSYAAKVLTGKLPASFKEASLFIDIFGRWRMAAMGMALGEERGMQMGEARSNPYPYAYPPPQATRSPETVAAPPPAAPAAASAPALTSTQASAVAKLKELKSLLNQGLITQSQYQADSQKLLNQIVD
jgi:hypothetical protein